MSEMRPPIDAETTASGRGVPDHAKTTGNPDRSSHLRQVIVTGGTVSLLSAAAIWLASARCRWPYAICVGSG